LTDICIRFCCDAGTRIRSLILIPMRCRYPQCFAEFRRVLRGGGLAVLLTTCKNKVTQIVMEDEAGWLPKSRHQVIIGGLKGFMHIIERRDERERRERGIE
jgi:hypothetical protein